MRFIRFIRLIMCNGMEITCSAATAKDIHMNHKS